MRFLVFYKASLLRHFGTALEALATEGHEIVLASPHVPVTLKLPGELARHPTISIVRDETSRSKNPGLLLLRSARNVARYFDPQLESAHANRERAWRRLVAIASQESRPEIPEAPWFDLNDTERRAISRAFAAIEDLVPPEVSALDFLQRHQPDAVLVTPLVSLTAPQTDVVKAARTLGIPCGLLVFSWDNLSNKGVIHSLPHKVFVWNEVQAREAVELHGVPREDVIITGAPRFDTFFERRPKFSRDEYRQRRGLDLERPLVLFLGSAPFVSEREPEVLEAWLEARKQADDELVRQASVLVRPHPRGKHLWSEFDEQSHEGVRIDRKASIYRLQDLYDQLNASDAVVGLNTSAQIEAAILHKPVYTFSVGDLAPGQEGSTHFHYLLREHGGFVEYAPDLTRHFEQLSQGLRGEFDADAIAHFAKSFVRPHGIKRPAAPILANALVTLAETAVPGAPKVKPHRPARVAGTDRKTISWLEEKIRPGDVIFDIGAREGAYSLVAARAAAKGGLVFAFEEDAGRYSRLCDTVESNGLGERIVPIPLALSDHTELQRAPGRRSIRMTLDDAVGIFQLPPPQLILLDVDGQELDVIRGARETLRNPALRDVLVNLGSETGDELVAALEAEGLELRGRHAAGLQSGSTEGEWTPEWWYGEFSRSAADGEEPLAEAAEISAG